jgi:hypothetical protein
LLPAILQANRHTSQLDKECDSLISSPFAVLDLIKKQTSNEEYTCRQEVNGREDFAKIQNPNADPQAGPETNPDSGVYGRLSAARGVKRHTTLF